MKKKILFRADGNSKTGLGHLFRLFALVEMYKENYEFTFLTRTDSVLDIIPKEYSLELVPAEVDYQEEPNWIAEKFPSSDYIIIADGYQFDSNYQKKIKQEGYFLMYIDDLASEYMYADIVVNHSPHIKETDFKAEDYTKFALGTDYAMLRPSFLAEAKKDRKIEKIDTAFICFGGADFYDLTFKFTQSLLNLEIFREINVVLGGAYKYIEIFDIEDSRLRLYKNLNELELLSIMKRCNFAIAPSSTILYELCCVKMPILSGYYVDNQRYIYKGFLDRNMIMALGNILEVSFSKQEMIKYVDKSNRLKDSLIESQYIYMNGNQRNKFLKILMF